MSIFSALVFQIPSDRCTRVISVVPPLHMTDHAIPKIYAGCQRTRKAGYSLVVKIDENYSIQSVQNPLFIRLGLERRIWMKRYFFGLSVLALILKNKRLRNNAQ